MSVAIHFAAKVSVSDRERRARPREARKEFTTDTRSDSCASRLAAAVGSAPGQATSKQAMRTAATRTRGAASVDNPSPPQPVLNSGFAGSTMPVRLWCGYPLFRPVREQRDITPLGRSLSRRSCCGSSDPRVCVGVKRGVRVPRRARPSEQRLSVTDRVVTVDELADRDRAISRRYGRFVYR